MTERTSTVRYSLSRDSRRFTVEALCLLMLFYGAPLQALEETVEPIAFGESTSASETTSESVAESDSITATVVDWVKPIATGVQESAQTVQQGAIELASQVVHQPWGDALAMLVTASSLGLTQAPSAPPSPPSDPDRPNKSYDLESLAAGFPEAAGANKNALDAVPLLPGWNQVSLPEVPAGSDPATVLAGIGGSFHKVYTYDGCDATDPWKVYDPNDATSSDLAAITVEQGLLIDATAAVSLPSDGSLPDSTTFTLCTGWNLIGFPSAHPRHVKSALAPILDNVVRVFAFDPFDFDDNWTFYEASAPAWASDLDLMEPGKGYWILVSEDVQFDLKNVGDAPVIAFTSPQDLDVITAPTEIQGTVASDLLESWQLRFRGVGENDWIELANGNYPVDGRLGDFDPTLLLNGMYELELVATDLQGQQVTDSIAIVVEGNMKIGHFTLSFVDLAIPLSGLDIQVVRTYDSRQRHLQGDFGYGWSLDIRQGSYRNNRPPGDGWRIPPTEGPWGLPCSTVQELKSHLTTVRLSDQEVYRFRLTVKDPGTIISGCIGRAEFEFVDGPVPGATLEILGNDDVLYQNNSDELRDPDSFALFVPEDVKLTTRDGRIFHLDLADGVTHLEDLNGNSLDITPEGITHSSGRGVEFERDAEGRIERIVDPMARTNMYQYDAVGDLIQHTNPAAGVTLYTFKEHYLEDLHNALGVRAIKNEYDSKGRVIKSTDAGGKSRTFGHDIDARRELITDRLGFLQVLEYDARGNVVKQSDQLGNTTLRTFDGKDRVLSETDPLGRTSIFVFSAQGDLTTTTNPSGHTTSSTFDSRGRILSKQDPLGRITSFSYDEFGNLLQKLDALENTFQFGYDVSGNVISTIDEGGNMRNFLYDIFGNRIRETNTLGHDVEFTYNEAGELLTSKRRRTVGSTTEDLVTVNTYNNLGRVLSVQAPDGTIKTVQYDALGRATKTTDELGRTTLMEYDSRGNLGSVSFPDGSTVEQMYDVEGREVGLKSRTGHTVEKVVDPAGRPVRFTMPDGAITQNAYDAAGQIASQIAANGTRLEYTYDASGRAIGLSDPSSSESRVFDAAGNLVASTDALGKTTNIAYDALDRRISTRFPDGSSSTSTYDALGRLVVNDDRSGESTRFDYDSEGRLIQVTDALGGITKYGYDEVDNLLFQTDAENRTTTFSYDRRGRQIEKTYPDGASELFTYNLDGTPATRTDQNGSTTLYAYDVNQRLVQRTYPDGSNVRFTYTSTGQRQTYTDNRGTVAYTYDQRDRVKSVEYPDGRSLHYTYDKLGQRISMLAVVDGENFLTEYAYDSMNRLDSIVDHMDRPTHFSYRHDHRVNSFTFPNGVTTSLTYDDSNRLAQLRTEGVSTSTLQSFDVSYSPTGSPVSIIDGEGSKQSYVYDATGRLTQERLQEHDETLLYQRDYTLDRVGNRTTEIQKGDFETTTITYEYDTRDRLLSQGGRSYGWDNNGNRVLESDLASTIYSWDYENRLSSVHLENGTEVRFSYDPDGTLINKVVIPAGGGSSKTIDFLNDTAGSLSQVVVESNNQGVDSVYTWANNLLISLHRPSTATTRYYHTDNLGSVRLLTSDQGLATDAYGYSAFGELLQHSGDDAQRFRFAGEQLDPDIGLSYHRARWLDNTVGRFPSVDPLLGRTSDPMSQHRYLYANADPVGHRDPSGLVSVVNVGIAATLVGNIAAGITGVTFYSLANRNIPERELLEAQWDSAFVGGQWGFNSQSLVSKVRHPVAAGILAGLMAFTVYPGMELHLFADQVMVFGTFGLAVSLPVGGPFGGKGGLDYYIGLAFNTDRGSSYPGHSFCVGGSWKDIPFIGGACFANNERTFSLTAGKYSTTGEKIVSSWAWASQGTTIPFSSFGIEQPPTPPSIQDLRNWGSRFVEYLQEQLGPPWDTDPK